MNDHERREEARRHLSLAHDKLRVARLLLREEEAPDSISRAYYALFHAAAAALALAGEHPQTHRGMQGRFWTQFVESGRFRRELGITYAQALQQRVKADYDTFSVFDTAAAADLLADAEAFVAAAETLVHDLLRHPDG